MRAEKLSKDQGNKPRQQVTDDEREG